MKDIITFINESKNIFMQFQKSIKKYGCVLQGPDSVGIAYLTNTIDDEYPAITLEIDPNASTFNFYDTNDGNEDYIIIDKDGNDNTVNIECKNSGLQEKNGQYLMNDHNAKILCDLLLKELK